MGFTTTLTSKNQLTLPASVRARLGGKGMKRKSRIMDFAGSLKHLDDGRPLNEIREEAQRLAAEEIIKRSSSK